MSNRTIRMMRGNAAELFLNWLDPNAKEFQFKILPEKGQAYDNPPQRFPRGTFAEHSMELRKHNDEKKYVGVMLHEATGLSGDDVSRFRVIAGDFDNGLPTDLPLEPSMKLETSPGRFLYLWKVSGDWKADEQGKADHAQVTASLREYGHDENAVDLILAARLPGFWNHKIDQEREYPKTEPFRVQVFNSSGKEYTRETLVKEFRPRHPQPEPDRKHVCCGEDVFVDRDRLQSALDFLVPTNDRDRWRIIGFGTHHAYDGSDEGKAVFDAWAKRRPEHYDQADQDKFWKSAKTERMSGKVTTAASIFDLAFREGWKDQARSVPAFRKNETEFNTNRRDGDLISRTMPIVRSTLSMRGSRPSKGHFHGLEQIATVIQAQADGDATLGQNFYVSSLPAGIGKTTTVIEAVRNLVAMPEYNDVGVIVFLSQVEQIEDIRKAMALEAEEYSVFTSDKFGPISKVGNRNKTAAKVMFTTQQMLASRCNGRDFADIAEFHFKGRPRAVRVWDEAIMPSAIMTFGGYPLLHLAEAASKHKHIPLEKALLGLSTDLANSPASGGKISVFDIEPFGVTCDEMQSWCESEEDQQACEVLFKIQGRQHNVRMGHAQKKVLTYDDTFPTDLGPLLILDASGPHREVYGMWYEHRKGLVFLPSPEKNYAGLRIKYWDRAAGRDAFSLKNPKAYSEIARTFADVIKSLPKSEPVFLTHFLPNKWTVNMRKETEALALREFQSVTWGKHTATNAYQDCPHSLVMGVLQYGAPENEGYGRSAKKLSIDDPFSDDDLERIRIGEIKHNLYQAVNRGMIRKADGENCPPGCTLHVVFSSRSIPPSILAEIFPGATVEEWKPVERKRKVKDSTVAVADALGELGEGTHRKQSVIEAVKITNPHRAWADSDLPSLLLERGWKIEMTTRTVTLQRALVSATKQIEDLPSVQPEMRLLFQDWEIDLPH